MKAIEKLILTTALGLSLGCTTQGSDDEKNSENENADIIIEEETPSDSTGTAVPVSLDLKSFYSANLWLNTAETNEAINSDAAAEATSSSLKLSDSLTLSMARFNLWGIKVKAKKEPSEKERDLEKKENAEELREIEELDNSESLGLKETDQKKKPDEVQTMKPSKPKDKIVADRDLFKKKMDDSAEKNKVRDKSTKFHGSYVYDAIAGAIEGDVPTVELNDGSYHRIEFKLKRNVSAEDSDPLLGNVFVVMGSYTKPGASETTPFEINWHSAMNFRLKGDSAFKVEAEGETKLSIVFDLQKWFEGIDLSTATVGDDGVIHINKSSNKEIMKQLRKNIKKNTRFGKDASGDSKIDASETAGQGEDTKDPED